MVQPKAPGASLTLAVQNLNTERAQHAHKQLLRTDIKGIEGKTCEVMTVSFSWAADAVIVAADGSCAALSKQGLQDYAAFGGFHAME